MNDLARGTETSLRLAEVAGVLALASDFGSGRSPGHALRVCALSVELARRSGVRSLRLRDVYYVALLRSAGCTAGAQQRAAIAGGDDLTFAAVTRPAQAGSGIERFRASAKVSGVGLSLPRRAVRLATSRRHGDEAAMAEADAAAHLAGRLGVGDGVVDALRAASERWDGKGVPGARAREDVPEPVRVVAVAADVELWSRAVGVATAAEVVARRSGRAHDPAVCAPFLSDPPGVLAAADGDDWLTALGAEPSPALLVGEERLDAALAALADFADLKSPWLRGHSRGVAELAADAGLVDGFGEEEVAALRRAGFVHDLGRVAVANGVWDGSAPLNGAGWEQVRQHPRVTERILSRSPALAPLARLASSHHERDDGSGYHRAASAADLTPAEQTLAAADAYQALTEDRPHRPALGAEEAGAQLRRDARAGRYDAGAVEAVVEAGRLPPRPPEAPVLGGLSAREVRVLGLVARGASDQRIAACLSGDREAAGAEVAALCHKLGVATRAGAALVAMEHGLLPAKGRPQPEGGGASD